MDLVTIVRHAIEEDLGAGDITTDSFDGTFRRGHGELRAKEPCVVAGVDLVREVFRQVDPSVEVAVRIADGRRADKGDLIAAIEGPIGGILKGERVALNFIQRLSGIATLTSRCAHGLQHAQVYDTRKTTPLLRGLEKMAVRAGGGRNHRMGLFDAILIKDNHVALAGSVALALRAVRHRHPTMPREVEVRNEAELREALGERAEILLLDNMTPAQVQACLSIISGTPHAPEVEVSGNIGVDTIKDYDLPVVHRISAGSLTHGARIIDMHLKFVPAVGEGRSALVADMTSRVP